MVVQCEIGQEIRQTTILQEGGGLVRQTGAKGVNGVDCDVKLEEKKIEDVL